MRSRRQDERKLLKATQGLLTLLQGMVDTNQNKKRIDYTLPQPLALPLFQRLCNKVMSSLSCPILIVHTKQGEKRIRRMVFEKGLSHTFFKRYKSRDLLPQISLLMDE